jgi:hypothetical protein
MTIRSIAGATILWMALPAGVAITQDHDQEERPITLVGCVMREHQYRDMYGPGLSGPRGAGIGGRNEYMLVDAREVSAAATTTTGTAPVTTATNCPPAPGTFPTAYELTGSREEELAPFLNQRVEVTGIQKEAHAKPVGTSGLMRPTGGFDPLGHELHLFEVEVESFREPAAAPAVAVAAEPPPAPEPAPEPAAAEPAPEVSAAPAPAPEPQAAPPVKTPAAAERAPVEETVEETQVARTELPRTAGPLPVVGLAGLLSLAAAAGLRSLRRRRSRHV